jgi:hypothetical protein
MTDDIDPHRIADPAAALTRVLHVCRLAETMTGHPSDTIEDPTPIPGWTTLVRNAIEGVAGDGAYTPAPEKE